MKLVGGLVIKKQSQKWKQAGRQARQGAQSRGAGQETAEGENELRCLAYWKGEHVLASHQEGGGEDGLKKDGGVAQE